MISRKPQLPLSRFLPAARSALGLLGLMAMTGCGSKETAEFLPAHGVLSEPQVAAGAAFDPTPALSGAASPSARAFLATAPGSSTPILLTAGHLVIDQPAADTGPAALDLPSSPDINSKTPAGDIAAFHFDPDAGQQAPTAPVLALADGTSSSPSLWLVPPSQDGKATLHRVERLADRRGLLYYRIVEEAGSALDLQSLAGAPVVNAAAEVVAIHLGGAEDRDGSQFGIGNPVTRFLPHLLAALPGATENLPSDALASTPPAED